jgi:hypothetical protein
MAITLKTPEKHWSKSDEYGHEKSMQSKAF